MSAPKRRTAIVVHGRRCPIKRVSQRTLDLEHKPESVTADYDAATGIIRIARGMPADTEEGLIEHEAVHAAIYELGLRPRLSAADPSGELEEAICNLVVPAVRAAMSREGT